LTADTGPAAGPPIQGVLLDLLMAVMNSVQVWIAAAGDADRGLAWRDGTTRRMVEAGRYRPYDGLVNEAAAEIGLGDAAVTVLRDGWRRMTPWPDATAIARLAIQFGMVTNTSKALARQAVERSGLRPAFVLAAEEAGCFKPRPEIYREACRRLGTAPDATLFVAGSPYDALGALRAGLRTALVLRRADHQVPDPRIITLSSLHEITTLVDSDE
jgi:2-haloacid dehalogenase